MNVKTLNRVFAEVVAEPGLADRELIRRFVESDDHAAFERLLRRHAQTVWRECRAAAGGHHSAEDAFQAAFLALARNASSIRNENVAGWLARVGFRAALKARRQPPNWPSELKVQAEVAPAFDDAPHWAVHELNHLADRYRVPIAMCYLGGRTQSEVAEELGIPLGTVATRVRRGCGLLRRRLIKRGITFTIASFGTGVVSESTIAAALRTIGDPHELRPMVFKLSCEASRMNMAKIVKTITVAACGVVAVIGLGLWRQNGDSRPASAVNAAPPPVAKTDRTADLENAWGYLHCNMGPRNAVKSLEVFNADPAATAEFLKRKMEPVKVSKEWAEKKIADVASDDEKTWKPAYDDLKYHNLRLVMNVAEVWKLAKNGQHQARLFALMHDSQSKDADDWKKYSFELLPESKSEPSGLGFPIPSPAEKGADEKKEPPYSMFALRQPDWPANAATLNVLIHNKPNLECLWIWGRMEMAIAILEHQNTRAGVEILKQLATGHAEAIPTKSAKQALARIEEKPRR